MLFQIVAMIAVVALMVSLNALFVAGEFSAVSARKTRIIQLAEQGNRRAQSLLTVIQDPHHLDNYIAASQVGITLSSIILGIFGQRQIAPLIAPTLERLPLGRLTSLARETAALSIAAILVLILLTTLQVVLGELVPKSLALQYPEKTALATSLPMKLSADYILRPLIILLNGSGALVLKLLGASYEREKAHVHSPEEILILLHESHEAGLIDAEERQMLRNVFRVSSTTAGEVAIPRNRLVAADVISPVKQVLELAASSAYTRIPVYEDNIDHIIGFVHLKDLFELYNKVPEGDLRSIVRQAPFIPETLTAFEILNRLNEENSYLAIVFDEYGGTAGLVTREDLIEELFGELQDEFDQEPALIAQAGEGRLIVRGDMLIPTLNELLNIQLPHDNVIHTIGGLVLDHLGRIPQVGDVVDVNEIRLEVEAVAGTTINAICLNLPKEKHDFDPEELI